MEKTYTHLSIDERTLIQTQLSMGYKAGQIACALGRSPCTLSRELKRNGWARPKRARSVGRPLLAGGCRAAAAQQRASACAVKPRVVRKLQPDTPLWGQVMQQLKYGH